MKISIYYVIAIVKIGNNKKAFAIEGLYNL